MRMNRRAFSFAPTASAPPAPGEAYKVILFSLTTGEDYTWGAWPDAVYGQYTPGTMVTVDLADDYTVEAIDNVEPYELGTESTIDNVVFDGSYAVSFTMPAFDVAVIIETNY